MRSAPPPIQRSAARRERAFIFWLQLPLQGGTTETSSWSVRARGEKKLKYAIKYLISINFLCGLIASVWRLVQLKGSRLDLRPLQTQPACSLEYLRTISAVAYKAQQKITLKSKSFCSNRMEIRFQLWLEQLLTLMDVISLPSSSSSSSSPCRKVRGFHPSAQIQPPLPHRFSQRHMSCTSFTCPCWTS